MTFSDEQSDDQVDKDWLGETEIFHSDILIEIDRLVDILKNVSPCPIESHCIATLNHWLPLLIHLVDIIIARRKATLLIALIRLAILEGLVASDRKLKFSMGEDPRVVLSQALVPGLL